MVLVGPVVSVVAVLPFPEPEGEWHLLTLHWGPAVEVAPVVAVAVTDGLAVAVTDGLVVIVIFDVEKGVFVVPSTCLSDHTVPNIYACWSDTHSSKHIDKYQT